MRELILIGISAFCGRRMKRLLTELWTRF